MLSTILTQWRLSESNSNSSGWVKNHHLIPSYQVVSSHFTIPSNPFWKEKTRAFDGFPEVFQWTSHGPQQPQVEGLEQLVMHVISTLLLLGKRCWLTWGFCWNTTFFSKWNICISNANIKTIQPFLGALPAYSFLTVCGASCLLYRKHSCFTTVFIDSSYLRSFFSCNQHRSKLSHSALHFQATETLPTNTCLLYHTYPWDPCMVYFAYNFVDFYGKWR